MNLDRPAFRVGVPAGPALVLLGFLVLDGAGVTRTDPVLLALAAWPTAAALLVAGLLVALPAHRRRWLSAALGSAVGTAAAVVVVAGAISALSAVLSDPAGRP